MSLNVVGLISGGKDSLYSLAHCIQNGHKIIALANLHPGSSTTPQTQSEDGERPDLDSFMYQTVGHSVVPLYADALGIPLYRKAITGTALQNGRYYETSSTIGAADETEDMYALVKEILGRHPEINALSAGAILSTYQRTRVESVAVRLGLVPLAYLWQYPALPPPLSRGDSLTGLLDDMDSAHCDARIIKIASGGVRSSMSFSNVANPMARAKLISGMAPFFADSGQEFWLRGAVLGEGGEYETLALDGPGFLWKKKIQIDVHETYEAEAGTVYVRLGRASVVQRDTEREDTLPVPVLLDKRFTAVQSEITASTMIVRSVIYPLTTTPSEPVFTNSIDIRSDFIKSSNTVQIFNLTSPGTTAAEQLETIIATLPVVLSAVLHTHKLPESCLASGSIVSTTLLLRSMDDFSSVNNIYSSRLWTQGSSNPPARVTIAGLLPREARVSISLIYDTNIDHTKARKGLHVQSRSYWAPANIGPYSQAVSVPIFRHSPAGTSEGSTVEVVHLAGQIPLVPATMSMLDASFVGQATLALQSLWRVAQERSVDYLVGAGVAFLAQDNPDQDSGLSMLQWASQAAQIWRKSHEIDEKGCSTRLSSNTEGAESDADDVDEDFDIWDHQQRHRGFGVTTQDTTLGEHLHKLPNKKVFVDGRKRIDTATKSSIAAPPFIAAEVVGLPRNAPIEWWSVGIAGLISMNGVQPMKVFSIPMILQKSWSLSYIAFENKSSERIDAAAEAGEAGFSDPGASVLKQQALCFFVTLVIESDITVDQVDHIPQTLEDLIPYLKDSSEDVSSLRYEVVMAKSFLNLSYSVAVSVHKKVELLQKSCIIPCDHVWSSQTVLVGDLKESPGPKSDTSTQGSELASNTQLAQEKKGEIREVVAAIVMRVDAFSE